MWDGWQDGRGCCRKEMEKKKTPRNPPPEKKEHLKCVKNE
jgi:hypothetical protein